MKKKQTNKANPKMIEFQFENVSINIGLGNEWISMFVFMGMRKDRYVLNVFLFLSTLYVYLFLLFFSVFIHSLCWLEQRINMKNTNNEKNKQQQHEASISHSIVYAFGEFTLDLKICKNKQIKEIEKKKIVFPIVQ